MAPPKHSEQIILQFPTEHALLLTLNRPQALNAINPELSAEIQNVVTWFDNEDDLWVLVITGNGRMFSAGADLKAWKAQHFSGSSPSSSLESQYGFAALSRRETVKPLIAAVNGDAYGGAVEILLNCDLVIASSEAKFASPEVKRGVVPNQGAIPRLAKIAGHQLASEMFLLGNTITAQDAYSRFGFVNAVVPPAKVVETALSYAKEIVSNSPDAVQSTKKALLLSQSYNHREAHRQHLKSKEGRRVYAGENIQEGLKAFGEKRKPQWISPAKL